MNEIRALLLDDEVFASEVLVEEVPWERYGITSTACAASVREAKAYLQATPVNLLLCDIEMPGESGLDMVEWATEYTRFSAEPMVCVMLTCHPKYEYLRKAMQLGCLDYLLKPVDIDDLGRCLEKAVEVIRQQRAAHSSRPAPPDKPRREDILAEKVFPFIEKNLDRPFSISDIADAVALNPQYLMRIFKKATGLSILEYVTQHRIGRAKELLIQTDWPLTVISDKVGYLNYTYFMKVFKAQESITPGEYRKRYTQ